MGMAESKQEEFWEACGFGNVPRVKELIDEGINVDWVSYTHDSCAIHAAAQGKLEIVKLLIDAKCNVNALDDRESLAIHHAAMKGETEIIELLIDAGSKIHAANKNGWTPLINAAYWCKLEAVKLLLKHDPDINWKNKDERSALHEACRHTEKGGKDLAEIVKILVDAGSEIDAKSSDLGEADFTPLMFTSYHGHTLAAKVLIQAGCDINAQGSNGWSALHWAAHKNDLSTVSALLDANIDPNLLTLRQELAFHRATDPEVKELLFECSDKELLAKYNLITCFTNRSPVTTDEESGENSSDFYSDDENENSLLGTPDNKTNSPLNPDLSASEDTESDGFLPPEDFDLGKSPLDEPNKPPTPPPIANNEYIKNLRKSASAPKTQKPMNMDQVFQAVSKKYNFDINNRKLLGQTDTTTVPKKKRRRRRIKYVDKNAEVTNENHQNELNCQSVTDQIRLLNVRNSNDAPAFLAKLDDLSDDEAVPSNVLVKQ